MLCSLAIPAMSPFLPWSGMPFLTSDSSLISQPSLRLDVLALEDVFSRRIFERLVAFAGSAECRRRCAALRQLVKPGQPDRPPRPSSVLVWAYHVLGST